MRNRQMRTGSAVHEARDGKLGHLGCGCLANPPIPPTAAAQSTTASDLAFIQNHRGRACPGNH